MEKNVQVLNEVQVSYCKCPSQIAKTVTINLYSLTVSANYVFFKPRMLTHFRSLAVKGYKLRKKNLQ